MKQMDTNGGSIDRSICTPRVWSCLIQPGAGRACFGPNCEAKAAVTCGRAVSATGIWEVLTSIQNPFEIHWNLIESFKIHSKSIQNPFKIHFKIHWHVKSMESTSKIQQNPSWQMFRTILMRYDKIWKGGGAAPNAFSPVAESAVWLTKIGSRDRVFRLSSWVRWGTDRAAYQLDAGQGKAAHGQHGQHTGHLPTSDPN
jgi:hypothetical protein